ncbi:MAG TPA: hypothetical protein PK478_01965 [Nitrospira sp.]|nr:hypothetical protein [Nitrospira sp.]HQW88582.1 hypothetical protein [Nitrospira sp.]
MIDAEIARQVWQLRQAVIEAAVLSAMSATPRRVRDLITCRAAINVLMLALTTERMDC